MTEFKKWFEENKKTWPYSPHDEQDCEPAWKAALEWVKGKIDYGNAGNDMIDWIFEEELDAKT